MHIIEQLKEAEKTFITEADQEQIKNWKIQVHESINIESLESIEGIKIFKKWLEAEQGMIAKQLVNKRDMTDIERALAFKRTDWINDVQSFFKNRDLDKLKEEINQQM